MKKVNALSALSTLLLLCAATAASAGQSVDLTRDEVAGLKKKMLAAMTAVGAPAGYDKEKESISLPTSARQTKTPGRYDAVQPGVSSKFSSVAAKQEKQAQAGDQKENEEKFREAAMKGDMAAMQKYMNAAQATGPQDKKPSSKDQLGLRISMNISGEWPIDPDNVVFEKPGVIAFVAKGDDTGEVLGNGKSSIIVFFDPIALKDTKQLSKVVLKHPKDGVASKTTIETAWVVLSGPLEEIKAWANRIDTTAILNLIDPR
jgi:hypothetical protein